MAQKFYTLLVLKKNQALELAQTQSYAEIMISQGNLQMKYKTIHVSLILLCVLHC